MKDIFVGLGQRVYLKNPPGNPSLENMVDAMKTAFNETDVPPLPESVKFDLNRKWLIGFDWTLMDVIRLSALFDDPVQYGMLIGMNGGDLQGLKLEARYEKHGDSTGCFKGRLLVPDSLRTIDYGTVAITIPEIALDLFRNGDFKLDIGFPYDLDFSRSFKLEALPYKGAGGFYFSRLSRETSAASKVPSCKTPDTYFDQITEAGLGLSLGVGRSFNKGPLKGELSLTADALLEGTMAKFHNKLNKEDSRFQWFKGVFGIKGRAYGEANVEAVVARIDATVSAKAEAVVESCKETDVKTDVSFSASGELEASFLGEKFTISKSFDFTTEANFSFGKKDETPPWETCEKNGSPNVQAPATADTLRWNPVMTTSPVPLELHFMPHCSLEQFPGQGREMKYAAMLYIDSPNDSSGDGLQSITSFERLAEGVLLWTLNAYLNRTESVGTPVDKLKLQSVTPSQLQTIIDLLADKSTNKLNYRNDIVEFLAAYYEIIVCAPPQVDDCGEDDSEASRLAMAFFPIAPDFQLTIHRYDASSPSTAILIHKKDFSHTPLDDADMTKLGGHLARVPLRIRSKAERVFDGDDSMKPVPVVGLAEPLAQKWFQDYMLNLAQIMMQCAIQSAAGKTKTVGQLVQDVMAYSQTKAAAPMISRFMLFGIRTPDIHNTTTPDIEIPVYELIGQQFKIPFLESTVRLTWELKLINRPNSLKAKLQSCPPSPGDDPLAIFIETSQCELDRLKRLKQLDAPILQEIKLLPPYWEVPITYSAKSPVVWTDGGTEYQMHLFSESIIEGLSPSDGGASALTLKKAAEGGQAKPVDISPDKYWAISLIPITLSGQAKPPAPLSGVYDITHVYTSGRKLLKRLTANMPGSLGRIKRICVLFDSGSDAGFQSEPSKAEVLYGNLSRTNMPTNWRRGGKHDAFLIGLLQCALTGADGYYLSYCADPAVPTTLPFDPLAAPAKFDAHILIQYEQHTPIAPYMNGVILSKSNAAATSVFFEDTLRNSKMPALPPGSIGFEVTRMKPSAFQGTDAVYVEKQFNLVSYAVKGGGPFLAQPDSPVPVCAIRREGKTLVEDPIHHFEAVIALPGMVTPPLSDGLVDDCIDPLEDPYAGLNEEIEIEANLRDAFGNMLAVPTYNSEKFIVLYRDFVIPAHHWPGTEFSYSVTSMGDLTITMIFVRPDGMDKDNIKDIYKNAYFQLRRNDMKVFIRTSLFIQSGIDVDPLNWEADKLDLLRYINDVLCCLDGHKCETNPYISSSSLTGLQVDHWQEWTVDLALQRTDCNLIDKDLRDCIQAQEGVTRIVHEAMKHKDGSPATPIQKLEVLAAQLRTVYKIRLATMSADGQDAAQSLWLVPYHEIGKLHAEVEEAAAYFCIPPISTYKPECNIEVEVYTEGGTVPNEKVADQQVNFDLWAKDCLSYIDEMLSSSYIGLVHDADDGKLLVELKKIKSDLAQCIADRLDHLGVMKSEDSQKFSLCDAREWMKQQLLYRLSNAYEMDTVIQQPAKVTSPFPRADRLKAPRLFGSVQAVEEATGSWRGGVVRRQGAAEPNKDYTLTTAKLPLTCGESWLTYGFSSYQDGQYKNRRFSQVTFTVTHLEHDIKTVEHTDDYMASSWLSMVEPIVHVCFPAHVPVAIREYPAPLPTLSSHRSVYRPQSNPLSELRKWDYECVYSAAGQAVGQDRVRIVVSYKPTGPHVMNKDDMDSFAAAIAQLRSAYPAIRAHLDKIRAQAKCASSDALRPVERFVKYATALKDSWTNKQQGLSFTGDTESYIIVDEKEMTADGDDDEDKEEALVVGAIYEGAGSGSLTDIRIQGFTTEVVIPNLAFKFYTGDEDHKQYLKYADRLNPMYAERTLVFGRQDLLIRKQAWGGVHVTRNESLFEDGQTLYKATNESFVYRTPLVRFGSPSMPLMEYDNPIDISLLDGIGSGKSIEVYMDVLMKELLGDRDNVAVRGSVSYTFDLLVRRSTIVETKVPHLLTLPFEGLHVDQVRIDLCNKMKALLLRRDGPVPGQGKFVIRLALYERLDSEKPMLAVNGLYLRTADIT